MDADGIGSKIGKCLIDICGHVDINKCENG